MPETEEQIAQRQNAADIITEIWRRARINAFAHRFAHEDAKARSLINRKKVMRCSLGSILSVISVYLVSTSAASVNITPHAAAVAAFLLTLLSVFFSIRALYLDVIGTEENLRVVAAEHEFLLGSYQYIAQRAREAKWPDRPINELIELLRDLERDFQLLKARGKEPTDVHFRMAHATFADVRRDPVSRAAQSYSPQLEDLSGDDPRQILDQSSFERGVALQQPGLVKLLWHWVRNII